MLMVVGYPSIIILLSRYYIIMEFEGGKEGASLSCHLRGGGWASGFMLVLDLFRFVWSMF